MVMDESTSKSSISSTSFYSCVLPKPGCNCIYPPMVVVGPHVFESFSLKSTREEKIGEIPFSSGHQSTYNSGPMSDLL